MSVKNLTTRVRGTTLFSGVLPGAIPGFPQYTVIIPVEKVRITEWLAYNVTGSDVLMSFHLVDQFSIPTSANLYTITVPAGCPLQIPVATELANGYKIYMFAASASAINVHLSGEEQICIETVG